MAGADEFEIRDVIDIAEMVKETVIMNSRVLIDMLINGIDVGEEQVITTPVNCQKINRA